MKTTVDVPDVLLRRAKKIAAREGKTLKAVIAAGLLNYLQQASKSPPSRERRSGTKGEAGEPPDPVAKAGEQAYRQFLLTEYDNVAQAHFDTGKSITHFFQFYLLVLTIPLTLAGIFLRTNSDTVALEDLLESAFAPFLALLMIVIALVGLSMMVYVTNLRLDVLLYARTVNGIRKYFTERAGLHIGTEVGLRTLPRSIHQPRYLEPRFFLSVVIAFALLDSVYAYAAALIANFGSPGRETVTVSFLILHLLLYGYLVRHRDRYYFRTHRIGIDIDGVIANHRLRFATVLAEQTKKRIDPDKITRIPVHECQGLEVTDEDEHSVFNRPEYWSEMDVYEGAARRIEELKQIAGYRIHIFSYRPWPNPTSLPQALWSDWLPKPLSWIKSRPFRHVTKSLLSKSWLIKIRTKKWLKMHGIKWNRLVIERGNVHMADSRVRTNNRFFISTRKHIRVFIDDDLAKARKLANICECVLLFDQSYNQVDPAGLPKNIIRVHSWDEIAWFFRDNL